MDVPGHERFIKNMLAGATGIDLVVLIIAADDSVMPQTREHLEILRLLGLKHGVIAMTKADLVDETTRDVVELEIRELVQGTFLADAPIVPTSAVTGLGLDKLKAAGAHCNWWMTDPNGPAFEAAMAALRSGYGRDAVGIGCGGSIGFVGPLAELFGGAPALLFGIEDPLSNAHAPNESLHEGDWKKLMASLVHLFDNIGKLPGGRVK